MGSRCPTCGYYGLGNTARLVEGSCNHRHQTLPTLCVIIYAGNKPLISAMWTASSKYTQQSHRDFLSISIRSRFPLCEAAGALHECRLKPSTSQNLSNMLRCRKPNMTKIYKTLPKWSYCHSSDFEQQFFPVLRWSSATDGAFAFPWPRSPRSVSH